MPNNGIKEEPRIIIDEMRKKSSAIATLSIWINTCLDIAQLSPPRVAPVAKPVVTKTPKRSPKKKTIFKPIL